ncbi:MAG: hypothetical protein JST54_28925 [Deltaproteobacteria bacterium]|nr:hypothetical protein [Deltaproteobacteria bacterium]
MPHRVAYARSGKLYLHFTSRAARDAWVAAAPKGDHRVALRSTEVPSPVRHRGFDVFTGETLETGPELPAGKKR